ncbi:hypothetical protein F5Y04DRAFT_280469 [Hypomontagnella monticulosa]|nr:hypothetical protein F5Y04DRAFT_280469 [Hypomontagnella monticulosa]
MDGPSDYISNDLDSDEYHGDELFESHNMDIQDDDFQGVSYKADLVDHSIDASTSMEPTHDRFSGKALDGHARARRTSARLKAVKIESPPISSESSGSPATRSSQLITPPEDTFAYFDDISNDATGATDIPSPDSSPTRKRHRKQQETGETTHGAESSKRNRFLERNRVAATKCRQKKKEWVSDLEETRFGLESQHSHLQMEYSSLKNEITQIKSQLMEHASCNDANIDKWIENEAKKFVLGASERYDQMLADMGHVPGMINRQGHISSLPGYPGVPGPELTSSITSTRGDSISFPPGTIMSQSPVFYRTDLTPNMPGATSPAPVEEPYPTDGMPSSRAEDATDFDSVAIANDTFQNPGIPNG